MELPILSQSLADLLTDRDLSIEERQRLLSTCVSRVVVSRESVTIHYRAVSAPGWQLVETLRR